MASPETTYEPHDPSPYKEFIDALALAYPGDIKEVLRRMLPRVGPVVAHIAIQIASDEGVKSLPQLWNMVKTRGEIKEGLKTMLGDVNRLAVIYFASKFENNMSVGTYMIKTALIAESLRMKGKGKLTKEDEERLQVIEAILGAE